MRLLKKAGTLMLAVFIASGIVGCGKSNPADTLVITALEKGYGVEWLENIQSAYVQKTGKRVKIVKKIGNTGQEAIVTEIQSLAANTDLYITEYDSFFKTLYSGQLTVKGVKYENYYADLTDLYQAQLEGENGATIESKMDSDTLNFNKVGNKYYSLPWHDNILGIVLNVDLWNKLGYTLEDLPRTTDEMFKVCDEIINKSKSDNSLKNIAPFIYSASDEYYSSIIHIWMSQYEGKESFNNYLNGKDPDGDVSEYVYTFDGQTKALEILETLLNKDNDYQHSQSDELGFTDMQGYFLSDQAVFCVNGSWLDIEMENYKEKNIIFMPTPVISSVTERFTASSDKSDSKLREIIDFVDQHTTIGDNDGKPSDITNEDVEIVREARQMKYKRGGCGNVFVPSFSTKIDMAKDFLKYMYSDEGLNIYYNTMNGGTMPLSLSTGKYAEKTNLTTFRQNIREISEEGDCFDMNIIEKTRLYSVAGILFNFNNANLGLPTYNLRNGKYTVSQIIDKNQKYVSDNWLTIRKKL